MNFFGLALGFIALAVIGLGFLWVIRGEYYLGYLWWPYFLGLGILLIFSSFFISSLWGSALLGVLGASLIWSSTELRDQAVRVELGWYPSNQKPKPQPPLAEKIKKWKAPHL